MVVTENVYNSPAVKSQHKVPRKYLKAWCDCSGTLYTLRRDGKLFSCGVEGIEAENYYYQFEDLSIDELRFLFHFASAKQGLNIPVGHVRLFMQAMVGSAILNSILSGARSDSSEFELYMQQASQLGAFPSEFVNIARMAWMCKYVGMKFDSDAMLVFDRIVKNGGEKLMCLIEDNAWHALDLALEGNVCEINESKDLKWHLAKYMVYQMMRGDKIREIFNEEGRSLPKESLIRVASYLRYFMSEVVLNSLEQHLSNMNIRLVENSTTEEFLTGDNPVFNLDCSMPPVEFTLFLPISPRRAIVLVDQNIEEKYTDILSPTIDKVRELNRRLCNGCISQIHASHRDVLANQTYTPSWIRK